MNKMLVLNNSLGVDKPLNKWIKTYFYNKVIFIIYFMLNKLRTFTRISC